MGSDVPHAAAAPLPPTAIAGQALFSGCLTTIDVRREALQAMVPRALTLPRSPAAVCRCLLVFGEQDEGTTFFGGLPMRWGVRYREFMFAAPFVEWKGGSVRYLFVLGMTCDFPPAVWNGNFYYGFRKRFAPMAWDGARFTIGNALHESGFSANVGPAGSIEVPDLNYILAAAALPVLGHERGATYALSQFEWDLREASLHRGALELTVGKRFSELPLSGTGPHRLGGHIVRRMCWRLSWPGAAVLS